MVDYWYARGYYDGRFKGFSNRPEHLTDTEKVAYKSGYDRGITDYCDYDFDVVEECN